MANTSRVAIIGVGDLGQALRKFFMERGISPELWDVDPALVPGQKSIQDTVRDVDYVFFCVSSWSMRAAVTSVLPALKPSAVLVSFAKGIEESSHKTMNELFAEIAPAYAFAVVGGPLLADEITLGKAAVGIIASKDKNTGEKLCAFLASPFFKTEFTPDVFTVALGGVLKNIYSVSLGIADGLVVGANKKGWLAARAIREMAMVAAALGADADLILGTAGVADFVATAYSPYSRNRAAGHELAKNGAYNLRGEGLRSLPSVMNRLGDQAQSFPLLELLYNVGVNGGPAEPAFKQYFENA